MAVKYSETEKEITTIAVYNKDCNGCKRHEKDIMISYKSNQDKGITDLFFTEQEGKILLSLLIKNIKYNKEE